MRHRHPAPAGVVFLPRSRPGSPSPADLFFFHRAIGTTTVANAALLCQLAPVMVVAALWIFGGERPGRG
ncbi:MAG TPA: EamA family transporter, partial [Tistrella mobilis]|nr:EamA family transporter [Tistrella mobilis]